MRNIIRYGIFLLGALFLLTSNALALSNPSNDNTELENNNNEPLGINICIDFIPYTHEVLRDNSDTIVTGTVKEILPPRWNTADGKRPFKLIYQLNYPDDIIYTDIVISVDEYLKNPQPSRELIVRVTGGTVGGFGMTTDADPSFNADEKVLLYLSKDERPSTKDIGPEHFIVTDYYRGKYTLTDDGKAVRPDENTTLEELLSTVKDSNSTSVQSKYPQTDNVDELANNDEPLCTEVSGSLVGLNRIELIKRSDTIVIGTVKEILPSKWNTADGKKPDPDVKFDLNNTIYTDIIICVEKYVKNPLSSKEVWVRVEGGIVENDTLLIDYEPTFQPGENVLLYLMEDTNPATKDIGPEHFRVTGFIQGKYSLTNYGKAIGFDSVAISQEESLSTINQTNKKSVPFISFLWLFAAFLGAVSIVRRR